MLCAVSDTLPNEENAIWVATNDIIFPGFIDLHNHPLYAMFEPWDAGKLFNNRYEWRSLPKYKDEISTPARTLQDDKKDYCDIAEFAEVAANDSPTDIRYFCSADQADAALHPVISGLQREALFARSDDDGVRFDKLRRASSSTIHDIPDLALIADMLSIQIPSPPPILSTSPQARKEATYAALLTRFRAMARSNPQISHWIVHRGSESAKVLLRQHPLAKQGSSPVPTECNPILFNFVAIQRLGWQAFKDT